MDAENILKAIPVDTLIDFQGCFVVYNFLSHKGPAGKQHDF